MKMIDEISQPNVRYVKEASRYFEMLLCREVMWMDGASVVEFEVAMRLGEAGANYSSSEPRRGVI
jgi:hypothetical protein